MYMYRLYPASELYGINNNYEAPDGGVIINAIQRGGGL